MFFQLYAHNVAVRGKATSAIYDLQHGTLTRIPNVLVGLLDQLQEAPLATVSRRYAHEASSFSKYLAFLQTKELGFCSEEPTHFPPAAFTWQYPGLLTHAVLEYNFQCYALTEVLMQLDELLCRHLELRLDLAGRSLGSVQQLLELLARSSFKTIALFVQYADATPLAALEELFAAHPKLTYIFCHSAPVSCQSAQHPSVVLTRWALTPGEVATVFPSPRYIVNPQFFAEAQQHNPYYNGKVCVSYQGQIKNCLRHNQHFGKPNDIRQVIVQEGFQEFWYACADKIEGLRDSALRYATCLSSNLSKISSNTFVLTK